MGTREGKLIETLVEEEIRLFVTPGDFQEYFIQGAYRYPIKKAVTCLSRLYKYFELVRHINWRTPDVCKKGALLEIKTLVLIGVN